MLDGELLQDGGGSTQGGSDNGQEDSRSAHEHAQWGEQSRAGFPHLQQICAKEDHHHADGLAPAREASAFESAMVESRVAAQLSRVEARRATTKMGSTCGS